MFGYGGIRLKLDQLEFKPRGHLPNKTTKLILRGIKYQGTTLDITIDNKIYEIFVRAQNSSDSVPLVYQQGIHSGPLKLNDRLVLPIDTHMIIRRSVPLCP